MGEVSDNGLEHVRQYLQLFPKARCFVIGFGTNDLGTWPDLVATSRRILDNLGAMVQAVRDVEKRPLLLNVPYANESLFPRQMARETREKRDYHNGRLREWCGENDVPLIDICSHLRDEHLGDQLHPNADGARVIAQRVFVTLAGMLRGE